jgi:predicted GNAT family N-acyltransferase
MEIIEIPTRDTYPLRQRVLRPHHGIESCIWPGDDDPGVFHLAAVEDGKQVCVASFYPEKHPDFKDAVQFRLRGMATHEDYRGKNIGKKLMQHAMESLRTTHPETLLWCNARTLAAGFYKKMDFEQWGEEFNITGVGPHLVMYKKL